MIRPPLLATILLCAVAGCGAPAKSPCQQVGANYCQKMYSCYSPSEIASFQLPAAESDCENQVNINCTNSPPMPGYCKGTAEVSEAAATTCANYIAGLTCDAWKGTPAPNDPCKNGLCGP